LDLCYLNGGQGLQRHRQLRLEIGQRLPQRRGELGCLKRCQRLQRHAELLLEVTHLDECQRLHRSGELL
jgi:hypothetical protein